MLTKAYSCWNTIGACVC